MPTSSKVPRCFFRVALAETSTCCEAQNAEPRSQALCSVGFPRNSASCLQDGLCHEACKESLLIMKPFLSFGMLDLCAARLSQRFVCSMMKRPATRALGKQQIHRCGCCGASMHRLESCAYPGAKKMQQLQKIVATLKHGAAPQNKGVVRKEKKWRKSSKLSAKRAAKARAKYSKRTTTRKPSPAEVQRRAQQGLPEKPRSRVAAIAWLLKYKFLRAPRACPQCSSRKVKKVFKCRGRPPHFRCSGGWTACQTRIPLYQDSVFAGLRLSPVDLVDALYWYTKCSQSQCPWVTSCIAACTVGRTTAEHILGSLRDLEASAGQKFCAQQMLKGNIEADATALSKFYVRASCETYKSAIDVLKTKLRKAGEQIPRASARMSASSASSVATVHPLSLCQSELRLACTDLTTWQVLLF